MDHATDETLLLPRYLHLTRPTTLLPRTAPHIVHPLPPLNPHAHRVPWVHAHSSILSVPRSPHLTTDHPLPFLSPGSLLGFMHTAAFSPSHGPLTSPPIIPSPSSHLGLSLGSWAQQLAIMPARGAGR